MCQIYTGLNRQVTFQCLRSLRCSDGCVSPGGRHRIPQEHVLELCVPGGDGGDGAGTAPRSLQVPRGHKPFWSTSL